MKKITKVILILIFVISCSSITTTIPREEGYKINKSYIEKTYNKTVDDSKVGFYISKNKYEFLSLIDNEIYHIIINKNGLVISSEVYPAYDPIKK